MAYSSIQDPAQGYAAAVDQYQRLRTSTCYPAVPYGSSAVIGTGGTSVAAARADRINIEIKNQGPKPVYLKLGTGASTSDFPLATGERFTLPIGVCYAGAFEAIDPTGGSTVFVVDYGAS